jgi:hypothetical protein
MIRRLLWLMLWAIVIPTPVWATPFELLIPKTIEINTAWWGAGLPIRPDGIIIAGSEPIDFPRREELSYAPTKHSAVFDVADYGFFFQQEILVLPADRGGRALAPHEVTPMSPTQFDFYGALLRPDETATILDPANPAHEIGFGVDMALFWPQDYVGTVTLTGKWKLNDPDTLFYTMTFHFYSDPNGPMGFDEERGLFDVMQVTEVQRVASVPVAEPVAMSLLLFGVAAALLRRRVLSTSMRH